MADMVIKGGTLLTMNGSIIENGAVGIEKGIITLWGRR